MVNLTKRKQNQSHYARKKRIYFKEIQLQFKKLYHFSKRNKAYSTASWHRVKVYGNSCPVVDLPWFSTDEPLSPVWSHRISWPHLQLPRKPDFKTNFIVAISNWMTKKHPPLLTWSKQNAWFYFMYFSHRPPHLGKRHHPLISYLGQKSGQCNSSPE